ncbi:hypothetical protein ACXHXM_33930
MDRINDHVMRRLGVSRWQLFESVERAALDSLPSEDYEFTNGALSTCQTIITPWLQDLPLFHFAWPHSPAGRFEGDGTRHRDLATAARASPSISGATAALVMEPWLPAEWKPERFRC